jgi:PD-(D/E)XK nuclease superfamily
MSAVKWSYSGLKDYINCPRQYHEVKVLKNFTKETTQQMLYGTVVHKALEDYVKEGTPLAKNYLVYKDMMDTILQIPGVRYPEHHMALDEDKNPCSFGAKEYWVRGIADLLVIDGDMAYIVDYKTGNNKYADPKQLRLMALMAFAHFPEIQTIKAGLLFVAHNSFLDENYEREAKDKLWESFDPELMRLKNSIDTDKWMANPTPLCGWCPVKKCEFHKVRR